MLPLGPHYQFRHGDHICVFYRSEDGLLEVLLPYITEGIRKHERCFCVQAPHILKRIEYGLRFIGVNVDAEIASGSLDFHPRDVYFRDGSFRPAEMLKMLKASIQRAADDGFSGFRTAGDLSWASDYCDEVVEYEGMVQAQFPGRPVTGLCQYPIESFSSDFLNHILQHHRQQIIEPEMPSSQAVLLTDQGDYLSEIVAGRSAETRTFNYVVVRKSEDDVIGWGHASSLEQARSKSEALMQAASQ